MRRWLYLAALSFLLMAVPVWAQRHGGAGGGSHFASAGGGAHFASRPAFASHSSAAMRGGSFGRGFGRAGGNHIRVGGGFHNHRGFHGRRGYYPYYGYYPYGYYGWGYDPFFYDDTADEDQDSYGDVAYSPSYPARNGENAGLQRDVQTLGGKIDRLQADVEARKRLEPDAEPETALVFRDQHVEEVRNYAISGGAVWVLNAQAAKKIPLVNLDIPATVKMNDDRGVDFQVPEPALQIMIVR